METQTKASWIFGTAFALFLFVVFFFAPDSLPAFKLNLVAFFCSLLAGLFAIFMTGNLLLKADLPLLGKWGVQAGSGIALFIIVLFWWSRGTAPIKPSVPEPKNTGSANTIPVAQIKPIAAAQSLKKDLPESVPVANVRDVSSGSVNLGCDQTLTTVETPEIQVGTTAKDINAIAVWSSMDNVKSYNQSTVYVRDPSNQRVLAVKGTGAITGLDSQSIGPFKNCPGGGHGTLTLHVTWIEDHPLEPTNN